MWQVVPDEVVACYLQPQRKYHTLEHIYAGLAALNKLASRLNEAERIQIEQAWWFHDSVYVIGAKDNEEMSAKYAADLGYSRTVQNMVLATVYPNTSPLMSHLQRIINDMDLCGFGASQAVYDHHTDEIRQEYPNVSDEQFSAGRKTFLTNLRDTQKPLFKTVVGHLLWEEQAQANITRDLKMLGA